MSTFGRGRQLGFEGAGVAQQVAGRGRAQHQAGQHLPRKEGGGSGACASAGVGLGGGGGTCLGSQARPTALGPQAQRQTRP